jgi:hypothetical protein
MTTNTTQSAARSAALEARGLIPSVNNHRIVPAPFACPEPRRAQPHPRKPFLATRHSLAQGRNTADEGPLTTEFLIANPELEFRLTNRKLSPLKISNRERIAISNRIQPPRRQSARHSAHHSLARGGSPSTKGDRFSLAAVAANRNSQHFRISPNSSDSSIYAFSNRNKTALFTLAANHRAQFTRHSQPRPQIDPVAAHAYTDPSTEGESPWKTRSY